jgi:prevent-host-death family protein
VLDERPWSENGTTGRGACSRMVCGLTPGAAVEKYELSEVKRRFSELVDRASRGEHIGIARNGKLAAVIRPTEQEASIKQVFSRMGEIRRRSKKPKNVKVKDLIEEGRR